MRIFTFTLLLSFFCSCNQTNKNKTDSAKDFDFSIKINETSLIFLGTIQDGGSPHIGCKKDCCKDLFLNPDNTRKVVSIGIIDPENKKTYLFEATPDLPLQMKLLKNYTSYSQKETPDAIFITHAHIGHYTGLMYLGKEAMNAKNIPVYVMPRMKAFLLNNGPWRQLVANENMTLQELQNNQEIKLTSNLKVTPFLVPHRDEFSETVGFIIEGPHKKVMFIPDIDKWAKWNKNIVEEIPKFDYVIIDGTFYDGEEINSRNISEIPHPFIVESMVAFKNLSSSDKRKIYFIHFNHTNPVLKKDSKQAKIVITNGFKIAQINEIIGL